MKRGPDPVTGREPKAATLAGDSQEQRGAEVVMLSQLSSRIHARLASHRFGTEDGLRVEVDGFSETPPVLVEIWAHIGVPKGGQKHKVLADALKLVWIDRKYLAGRARKIILFADSVAIGHFQRRSWMGAALRDLGIELLVEELPDDIRREVIAAQKRQYR